jgi:hypothetical protein
MELTTAVVVTEASMNKILRRLGLKDDYGYCDTSIVGFIVLWSAFGYGFYITVLALIDRFS